MTEYAVGSCLRHRKRGVEWGVGVVIDVESAHIRVRFENGGARERRFRLDGLAALFEVVPPEDVPESSPLRRPKKAKPGKSKATTGAKCSACSARLNRSRYSTDGRWKSCPRCSSLQGHEHVYRRYPDAFGTTTERATEDNPDGIQSYCQECRQESDPDWAGTSLCSDLTTQSSKP